MRREYRRAFPDKTQQAISEQVGCSHVFVGKIQNELVTSYKLVIPETRKGADGKDRPTTYKRAQVEEEEARYLEEPETERTVITLNLVLPMLQTSSRHDSGAIPSRSPIDYLWAGMITY